MTTRIDPERSDFERLMREKGYDMTRRKNGSYIYSGMNFAWLGWQLAKGHQSYFKDAERNAA